MIHLTEYIEGHNVRTSTPRNVVLKPFPNVFLFHAILN